MSVEISWWPQVYDNNFFWFEGFKDKIVWENFNISIWTVLFIFTVISNLYYKDLNYPKCTYFKIVESNKMCRN